MTEKIDLRALTLGILLEVSSEAEYSHIALRNVLDKYQYLEKQERAFLTRLVEGTLERRIELDYIIDQFSSVKVKKQKPVIREILRLSVYQLRYMDSVPDSAVCNEAVKLAKKKGFQRLTGFVNGVLRNIARNRDAIQLPSKEEPLSYLSVCYSMPEWIVEEWLALYGFEKTETILQAFYQKTALTIRANQNRILPEKLQARLEEQGLTVRKAPYVEGAFVIEGFDYLGALPEFQKGLFQVQDVSSMLAAKATGAGNGDTCIDLCAAPGGKSLYLAEMVGEKGHVDARDLTEYKADLIRENVERLGMTNLTVSVRDARLLDEVSKETADVVLADLPCSGLGVLAKKSDIKYRMSKEQQVELQKLQREILKNAASYVKPGGILVYSTCTIHQGENEEQAAWFLKNAPFEAVSLDPCLPQELHSETTKQGYLQLLPGVHACDGFFIAKFRKTATS